MHKKPFSSCMNDSEESCLELVEVKGNSLNGL